MRVDTDLRHRVKERDDVRRLMTIPGVGALVATTIVATVGDVSRFGNAKVLWAYAGLVPSVRQSGSENVTGRITKTGSQQLRAVLVQAAHVVIGRCLREETRPLQAVYHRVKGTRGRRKIATVALARHLLRVA